MQDVCLNADGRIEALPAAVMLEPKDKIIDIDFEVSGSQLVGVTNVGKVHHDQHTIAVHVAALLNRCTHGV